MKDSSLYILLRESTTGPLPGQESVFKIYCSPPNEVVSPNEVVVVHPDLQLTVSG